MKELTHERIEELVSHILETMAFVFVEAQEEAEDFGPLFHSKISYFGPDESTDLFLSASQGFLVELASSMLGMEPNDIDPAVEGLQALDELANIVCGEVIQSIGGEDAVFSQGIPERVDGPTPAAENSEPLEVTLDSEGEPLRVILSRVGA